MSFFYYKVNVSSDKLSRAWMAFFLAHQYHYQNPREAICLKKNSLKSLGSKIRIYNKKVFIGKSGVYKKQISEFFIPNR